MFGGMDARKPIHVPVLPAEVLEWLDPQAGQIIVDGTLGGGGHTRLMAERIAGSPHPGPLPKGEGGEMASGRREPPGNVAEQSGFVLALDRDPAALAAAEQNLAGLPVQLAQS